MVRYEADARISPIGVASSAATLATAASDSSVGSYPQTLPSAEVARNGIGPSDASAILQSVTTPPEIVMLAATPAMAMSVPLPRLPSFTCADPNPGGGLGMTKSVMMSEPASEVCPGATYRSATSSSRNPATPRIRALASATIRAGPRSDAGEARPTLPPIVARARTGGDASRDAASARA